MECNQVCNYQFNDLNCFVNNKNTIPSDIEMQSLYHEVFLTYTAYCSYMFITVMTVLVIKNKSCKCHKYPIYKNLASLSFRKACSCLWGSTVFMIKISSKSPPISFGFFRAGTATGVMKNQRI